MGSEEPIAETRAWELHEELKKLPGLIAGAASVRPGIKIPLTLRVNPKYPGRPKYIGRQPWNMNCVNCAVAVDQILAGSVNVLALPDPQAAGFSIMELEDLYNSRFVEISSKTEIEALLRQSGNGSRGIVFGMRDALDEHGHVFNVVNLGGEIVFIDGQSGRYANIEEFTDLGLLRTN